MEKSNLSKWKIYNEINESVVIFILNTNVLPLSTSEGEKDEKH